MLGCRTGEGGPHLSPCPGQCWFCSTAALPCSPQSAAAWGPPCPSGVNRDLFPSSASCSGADISPVLVWAGRPLPLDCLHLCCSPCTPVLLGPEDWFICQLALPGSLSKLLFALCVLGSDLGSCFFLGCVWRVNGPEVEEGFETPRGKHGGGVMHRSGWKLVQVLLWGGDVLSPL